MTKIYNYQLSMFQQLSMCRYRKRSILIISSLVMVVFVIINNIISNNIEEDLDNFTLDHSKYNSKSLKIDWHDHAAMIADRLRIGVGEQGEGAFLLKNETEMETNLYSQNGFNALLSDKISLFRSIPDIRHPLCKRMEYLSDLPTVSVIIIFYNEHWSTLLRTIYSVLIRSPEKLIYEIIIVDDGSEKEFLGKKLDNYVAENLTKVKIVRHKVRKGLIKARLSGAKVARGEVLIFLDSHVEPNYNWLPPLLEPIAYNPKTVVCPFIDSIDNNNFKYNEQDAGARGGFDWEFHYKRFPLLKHDLKNPTTPFNNPVMAGGLFAINRKWFWLLGGYDPELDIWGGEQYELSFKIWMCGGKLIDTPCSRIGHIYRGKMNSTNPRIGIDFVHRNYKRVAEVWMDEYATYLYARDRTAFKAVDAGDLSNRKAIRTKLHCKSFDWYMKDVAFDLITYYPAIEPPNYANGSIQSMANPNLCVDTLNHAENEEPGLYPCHQDDTEREEGNQYWELTWHKDIKSPRTGYCLDASGHGNKGKLTLLQCHGTQGNQGWFYNYYNELLEQSKTGYCLEANIKKETLHIKLCNKTNINMKWKFTFYNKTALNLYYKVDPDVQHINYDLKQT